MCFSLLPYISLLLPHSLPFSLSFFSFLLSSSLLIYRPLLLSSSLPLLFTSSLFFPPLLHVDVHMPSIRNKHHSLEMASTMGSCSNILNTLLLFEEVTFKKSNRPKLADPYMADDSLLFKR